MNVEVSTQNNKERNYICHDNLQSRKKRYIVIEGTKQVFNEKMDTMT